MTNEQQAVIDKQCKAMAEEIEQLRGFVTAFEGEIQSMIRRDEKIAKFTGYQEGRYNTLTQLLWLSGVLKAQHGLAKERGE
jgi:hypothetical protein